MASIAKEISKYLIEDCNITPSKPTTVVNIKNSENDGDLKLIKVDIKDNNDTVLCFSFDNISKKKKLIENSFINIDWINKKVDGIIYKYDNQFHNFIIIEVKTENPSGCKEQHKSIMAYLTYLIKALELEFNISIMKNVVFYKVLVTSRLIRFQIMNNKGVPYNDKIEANEIQFIPKESKPIPLAQLLDCKKFYVCKDN